jgi:aminopeptidase
MHLSYTNNCFKYQSDLLLIRQTYKKLAEVVVHHSLEIKKGHKVYINGPVLAQELIQAIYLEALKVGAYPYVSSQIEGLNELFFKNCSEEQLNYVSDIERTIYGTYDRFSFIKADYNTQKFSTIEPKALTQYQNTPERKKIMDEFYNKDAKGELKWNIVPFPCNSLAQDAKMDLFTYTEFVKKALHLDKENPIQEWQRVKEKQAKIIEKLETFANVHVIGEDTDLTLSIKGRKWRNCCGDKNLPDGEVYTGPIENSVNGHIRFTFPGIYLGKEIENIYLEFKDGKVVNANAEKGKEILQEVLKIKGADVIGEFAIGTNYGITKFTKNMLFDEKMGGTMHCALGMGFKITGSKNESSIHWDLLKDMKLPGSKIIANDTVIYEEGKWKI